MTSRVPSLSPDGLKEALGSRPFTVVHLDAEWDGYRSIVNQRMEGLLDSCSDTVFGYMDVDLWPDHARAIHLLNVPACSYYRGASLVATVIGIQQDIARNLDIIGSGGTPDTPKTISRF
jgi:hypothetical protein